MSYQVLARKWRPKNFQQLVGQEHVVTVLANALSQNRLHHAYLFTGTRGVGKTTIARIFAKSLNCDLGITDKPCGQCDTCLDIDQGRFVDLLEIDAASKTKVDDTREILDNVQYAPSRGRFKVYLIDEVHMLSRHSFNALLKTLEEPPEHVKFILATTDPQKLPITVLSRCLQFHLKALTVKQIESKLTDILVNEDVSYEPGCLSLLAKSARGSMRDSLSLTDQAIAQGQGNISLANIQKMLGGIDQQWVYQLVICLLKQDAKALMELSQQIASFAPSYSRLFAELIQLFHQIALLQIVEQHFDLSPDLLALLKKFSNALAAEDVQLYYQIALNGRKDLPYAADEQAAFDMTLLRLLAFKPAIKSELPINHSSTAQSNVLDFDEELAELSTEADTAASPLESVESSTRDNETGEEERAFSHQTLETQKLDNTLEVVPGTIENDLDVQDSTLSNEAEATDISAVSATQELNQQQAFIEEQAEQLHSSFHDTAPVPAAENHTLPEQRPEDNTHQEYVESVPFQSIEQAAEKQPQELFGNIEAQANSQVELTASQALNTPEKQDTDVVDSPVSSVLATRNMLRSRRKALEKEAKKSSGASVRQTSAPQSTANNNNQEEQGELNQADNDANALATQVDKPAVVIPEPVTPYDAENIDPATIKKANQVDKWAHMIDAMQLTARIRQLAIHATISEESTDDNLILLLDQATRHLKTDVAQQQLQQVICDFLSRKVTVTLTIVEETVADPYQIQSQINDKRFEYATKLMKDDEIVQAMQSTFQAELDETTITPL